MTKGYEYIRCNLSDLRCGQLQPVAGRDGWLDGVRSLWNYDEISLEGTGPKAGPGIRNPKAAGPERTRRLISAFSEGGHILAIRTDFMALKADLLPQLPPPGKRL